MLVTSRSPPGSVLYSPLQGAHFRFTIPRHAHNGVPRVFFPLEVIFSLSGTPGLGGSSSCGRWFTNFFPHSRLSIPPFPNAADFLSFSPPISSLIDHSFPSGSSSTRKPPTMRVLSCGPFSLTVLYTPLFRLRRLPAAAATLEKVRIGFSAPLLPV